MPRAKFSYFAGSLSQFRKDCMSRNVIFITRTVSFSVPMSVVSGLLIHNVLSVTIDLSQYINMLADSSTGSGLLSLCITLVINFTQGIYNYVPETHHVSSVYSAAAVLTLSLTINYD